MNGFLYERKECRLCLGAVRPMLSLTPTPIANNFTDKPDICADRYRLDLSQCVECDHVQIRDVVADEVLFPRQSSTAKTYEKTEYKYRTPEALKPKLEAQAREYRHLHPEAKVVMEIGANNGLFVHAMHDAGFPSVFGVDPCGSDWTVWNIPFDAKASEMVLSRVGKVDLIIANNVFAHVDDLAGMFRAVDHCLSDDGALIFEVQSFEDLVASGSFDMIYHEHRDYHTLGPLPKFLKVFGLVISYAERFSNHGGSLRVHCKRPGIAIEVWRSPIDWRRFARRIESEKLHVKAQLEKESGRIVAFGAAAKATTLLHHFGIADQISYCVDDTPEKQGKYIPGTAIQISQASRMEEEKPDVLFLTAWNYESIIAKRFPQYRMIVPFKPAQLRAAA